MSFRSYNLIIIHITFRGRDDRKITKMTNYARAIPTNGRSKVENYLVTTVTNDRFIFQSVRRKTDILTRKMMNSESILTLETRKKEIFYSEDTWYIKLYAFCVHVYSFIVSFVSFKKNIQLIVLFIYI